MTHRITALLLLLTSCAAPVEPDNSYYADPAFVEYLESFQYEAAAHGRTVFFQGITVVFADLEPPTAATCTGHGEGSKIEVDAWAWNLQSFSREQLMFHELGHCLMSLDHTPSTTPAIMNPNLMWSSYYQAHRAELLNDFFN